jgi:hypothetical protein
MPAPGGSPSLAAGMTIHPSPWASVASGRYFDASGSTPSPIWRTRTSSVRPTVEVIFPRWRHRWRPGDNVDLRNRNATTIRRQQIDIIGQSAALWRSRGSEFGCRYSIQLGRSDVGVVSAKICHRARHCGSQRGRPAQQDQHFTGKTHQRRYAQSDLHEVRNLNSTERTWPSVRLLDHLVGAGAERLLVRQALQPPG